jgi:hypothetical protein
MFLGLSREMEEDYGGGVATLVGAMTQDFAIANEEDFGIRSYQIVVPRTRE